MKHKIYLSYTQESVSLFAKKEFTENQILTWTLEIKRKDHIEKGDFIGHLQRLLAYKHGESQA